MILTICPNPALDKIIFIEKWIAGTPMRTNKINVCVGGKGLNSSVALRHLGLETVGMGFFAGKTGKELIEILEEYGVQPLPVWVDGETRISHVIAERDTQIHSHVITGDVIISENQKTEFFEKYKIFALKANWIIFGGSLPASLPDDFYVDYIDYAKKIGVPSLIDSQKESLVYGIKAQPEIVKMNREEFEWTFNQKADSHKMLISQARELRSSLKIQNLVMTLSREGIIALTTEGNFYAVAPQQVPVNAAGAGDSASSALVWKLSEHENWETALRWAAAVSSASVLTERTADFHFEDVNRIFPQVRIEKLVN